MKIKNNDQLSVDLLFRDDNLKIRERVFGLTLIGYNEEIPENDFHLKREYYLKSQDIKAPFN